MSSKMIAKWIHTTRYSLPEDIFVTVDLLTLSETTILAITCASVKHNTYVALSEVYEYE